VRNLLAFLAAALIAFLGLGWYLDWYKVSSAPSTGGHRQVKIDINANKIGEDLDKGSKKVRSALEKNAKKEGAADQAAEKKKPAPEKGAGEVIVPPEAKEPVKGAEPADQKESLILPDVNKSEPAPLPPPDPK
jgi:hypothetical protein